MSTSVGHAASLRVDLDDDSTAIAVLVEHVGDADQDHLVVVDQGQPETTLVRVHPAQDSPLGVVRNRRKDGTLTPCTRAGGSRRPNGRQSIFECSVVISGPRAISGELDVGTAPTVGIVLSDPDITDLDLGEITFIDAAGLRVLLTANRQRSARLGLLSVSRPVQRLFELTGHLATFRWATAATVLPDRPDLADPEGQNGF